MLESLIKILPNLGVVIAAVLIFGVFVYFLFKLFIDAIDKREEAFRSYVVVNNHKTTEILVECRDVIKEAADNIRQSTEIQKQVVEHLIKENK